LRPTQVKSLVALDEQSSIPVVDESMTSAAQNVKEMFASKISTTKDVDKIDDNFNLDTAEKPSEVLVEHTDDGPGTARANQAAAAGGGKVLGWKARLAALREQKAQKATEESKTTDFSTEAAEQDPLKASVQGIFAPAPGLERGKDGKLQVDKAQVPEKVEPVFEKKSESAAGEALGQSISSLQTTKTASSGASTATEDKEKKAATTTASPTKPRMTLLERQAEAEAKRKEAAGGAEAPKPRLGGLQAPSRLARPTAAVGGAEAKK